MSRTEQSPGEKIAAALRRNPVYVDPAYASAVPPAKRAQLLAQIRKSPIPIYILAVPLQPGGTWSDPEQLATVIHDRLGRDGAYITLDNQFVGNLNAYQFGGSEAEQRNTQDAAWAVGFQRDMAQAPLGDRLVRCVRLIAAGDGQAVYNQVTASLSPAGGSGSRRQAQRSQHSGVATGALATGAAVAVLGITGLAVWRWRRTAARRAGETSMLPGPRHVLATARQADEEQLRELASSELIKLGEAVESANAPGEAAQRALAAALDDYQAAGKVLDAARGIPDLAGVLVLVDQGRGALAEATARSQGRPPRAAAPLCFFNPLHGDALRTVNWRPLGQRGRLRVKCCQACAAAAGAHETPDILMDGDVPYFEAHSVWAETGYGQLRDDLGQRIQRGDLTRDRR